jgi:hypothetical protein
MATTDSHHPVNGNYAPQGYDTVVNNFNAASANSAAGYGGAQQQSTGQPSNSAAAPDGISKDEVGWYFVEQYYTTLSKTPDKLYVSRATRETPGCLTNLEPALLQQTVAIRLRHRGGQG